MDQARLIAKLEYMKNPDWHFTEEEYKIVCTEALACIRELERTQNEN